MKRELQRLTMEYPVPLSDLEDWLWLYRDAHRIHGIDLPDDRATAHLLETLVRIAVAANTRIMVPDLSGRRAPSPAERLAAKVRELEGET